MGEYKCGICDSEVGDTGRGRPRLWCRDCAEVSHTLNRLESFVLEKVSELDAVEAEKAPRWKRGVRRYVMSRVMSFQNTMFNDIKKNR